MEIKDFKVRKDQFEIALKKAIQDLVNEFEEETGFSPENITVNLIDLQQIGSLRPTHIVESVRVDIDI